MDALKAHARRMQSRIELRPIVYFQQRKFHIPLLFLLCLDLSTGTSATGEAG